MSSPIRSSVKPVITGACPAPTGLSASSLVPVQRTPRRQRAGWVHKHLHCTVTFLRSKPPSVFPLPLDRAQPLPAAHSPLPGPASLPSVLALSLTVPQPLVFRSDNAPNALLLKSYTFLGIGTSQPLRPQTVCRHHTSTFSVQLLSTLFSALPPVSLVRTLSPYLMSCLSVCILLWP